MISNKCYYALQAMLELAVREGDGPVTIGEIAEAKNIPVRFLEAILRQLKQAGFADSLRGKEGGYSIAKPSKKITVGSVIRLFEGPFVSVNVLASHDKRSSSTRDPFSEVWKQAETALANVFDRVSFHDLAEREKSRTMANVANYSI